jgi:3-deoxy-7-phosphoheptulonate synthase
MSLLKWNKSGWRDLPIKHQPIYADNAKLDEVLGIIGNLPPLVFSGEVENLKAEIAQAGRGERFILQGGDCAELFRDCSSQKIVNKLKILLQMSVILAYGAKKPVVRIGRIAGQYAKPRSSPTEVINGVEMASYMGDAVNNFEAYSTEARTPNPDRLLSAYFYSASSLNFIRAMIDGGFADLHHPHQWDLYSFENSPRWEDYQTVIERILDALEFMQAFGGIETDSIRRVDFFTSHEGLLLGYEEALTRKSPITNKYYNLGAHMLWIGERTRDIDGAHVEYFRGIDNPVGVKIGASTTTDYLIKLLEKLNPENEEGKVMLITRFGAGKAEKVLPSLIKAVKAEDINVTWSCDPMHGNTITANESGVKTRDFEAILTELRENFIAHRDNGSYLGGVHFELTGDNVTECIGGAGALKDADLCSNYETFCDPRMNYSQGLEMAFLIAGLLNEK